MNEHGVVSGIESSDRVVQPSGSGRSRARAIGQGRSKKDSSDDHDDDVEDQDYGDSDAILCGEMPTFIKSLQKIDAEKQRTVEEIFGYDDIEESSGSESFPCMSDGDENFKYASMGLYANCSKYGRHRRKKERKVKEKRLERMLSRGYSLKYLDQTIRNFVLEGNDMYVLPEMAKCEVEQVRSLASLYKCKFSLQGTNGKKGKKKKNLPVLVSTNDTEIPSGKLEEKRNRMFALEKEALRKLNTADPQTQMKGKKGGQKSNVPKSEISFVSHGYIHPEDSPKDESDSNAASAKQEVIASSKVEEQIHLQPSLESKPMAMMTKAEAKLLAKKRKKEKRRKEICLDSPRNPNSAQGIYASFEKHTTGIGSKLLSKWGFQKGMHAGLGKQNDGITEPIQVASRPKSLGLGA